MPQGDKGISLTNYVPEHTAPVVITYRLETQPETHAQIEHKKRELPDIQVQGEAAEDVLHEREISVRVFCWDLSPIALSVAEMYIPVEVS